MEKYRIDELKYIFDNVNSWLNFAEIKNGVIIAINITFIIGVFETVDDKYGKTALVLFGASLFISLISHIPKLNKKIFNIKKENENKNLIFFKDISLFKDEKEYLEKLNEKYFKERVESISKYEKDLAEEIVINSKIAVEKYFYFNISIVLLIIGLIFLIISKTI